VWVRYCLGEWERMSERQNERKWENEREWERERIRNDIIEEIRFVKMCTIEYDRKWLNKFKNFYEETEDKFDFIYIFQNIKKYSFILI